MWNVSRFATVVAAVVVGVAAISAKADITVVSWGGAYVASQQRAFGESWERKTGKTIHWVDYNGDIAEVRAQVESGEILWDIIDVFAHEARLGCREGLFEKLPRDGFTAAPDGTPMDRDLVVALPNDCVAPNILWSWLTFYDETSFAGVKPETIVDFFDLERFPGTRGLSVFPQGNIEMALVADGVEPSQVYDVLSTPEGVDRAFAKLDTIKPQVKFWSGGDEPVDFVTGGEVIMSTAYSGRVGAAILAGATTLQVIWDGQVLDEEWLVMVKGSKNYDEALDFLIHASAPEQLANQAKWISYGPMRHSSLAIIAANEPWFNTGKNIMPYMPNRKEVMARTTIANPDWWADSGDTVVKRFVEWMGR